MDQEGATPNSKACAMCVLHSLGVHSKIQHMDGGTCSLMHNAHYFVDLVYPLES